MALKHLTNRIRASFELLYWKISKPQSEGAKLLIRHGDKYLLIRETYGPSRWTFPGGKKRRSETQEDAARRRAKREVGISLDNLTSIGSYFHTRQHKKDVVCAYYATVSSPEHHINKNFIAESGWFTLEEIPHLERSESVDDVLDLYNKHQETKDPH